jgi:hypothetical protein
MDDVPQANLPEGVSVRDVRGGRESCRSFLEAAPAGMKSANCFMLLSRRGDRNPSVHLTRGVSLL